MTIHDLQKNETQTAFDKTRLVFFDMDQTILNTTGYQRENFLTVLDKLYEIKQLPRVQNAGNPMMVALKNWCTAAGIGEAFMESQIKDAERLLVENMRRILPDDLRDAVLPGVVDLLEALSKAQIPVGLTTGTLREVAVPILKKAGLLGYFPLTVFGDQAEAREDIVRSGLEKAAWVYGLANEEISLVTVGDAVTDVRAGKAFGARTISVTTGSTTKEELQVYQPDFIFPDLTDTTALFEAIVY
jgi:phosphoglycolate phosphatase-like HAD superfamily hydrolase